MIRVMNLYNFRNYLGVTNVDTSTGDDCRVGNFENEYELPPGTIRNQNGRGTRSDKKIGTIRKEAEHPRKSK